MSSACPESEGEKAAERKKREERQTHMRRNEEGLWKANEGGVNGAVNILFDTSGGAHFFVWLGLCIGYTKRKTVLPLI